MKDTKYSKRFSRWDKILGISKRRMWNNLYYNVGLIFLAGLTVLIITLTKENAEGNNIGMAEAFKHMIYPMLQQEPPLNWNYSSYSFQPNVSDWDEQRTTWIEEHPNARPGDGERPKVLMVTGSSTAPCENSTFSHLLLRAGKNKVDYSRMHDMELYYSLGNTDPEFSDWWVKLPVIRMLMLQHPEFEWIWWLDADAVLTDMSFEPPFRELDNHNLVLYGEDRLVYKLRDWTSLSTSNYMIRNCQWSLDLLNAWGSMGTASRREESGIFQSEVLANRPLDFPGDDQSSLVVLLAQDKKNPIAQQKWVPMVKLVKETEFSMNGNWEIVGPKLEELSRDQDHGQQVPFVTHFRGCLPSCTTESQLWSERSDACVEQLGRAFDFADNQVYQQYGFQPRTLGSSSDPLEKNPSQEFEIQQDTYGGKTEVNAEVHEQYRISPPITDWDERRKMWLEKNPSIKREEVLQVSGSAPKPMLGSHLLLRGLKNRIDYGRINGVKVFYNMAVIHKDLIGWWSKLPLVKMLMLSNPQVEWIWWMDSDAVLTDMNFRVPFARYNASGYNLALYGSEHGVFEEKNYVSINTGDFLFRNCQWSLDLLDRWASFAATKELRVKNEELLNNLLVRSPGWEADDQSVLVYVFITERDKWASKVCLESSYAMSGDWSYWVHVFVDDVGYSSPQYRPFVTHFAGCKPFGVPPDEECAVEIARTYNFADNQVLARYGLRHEHLNSSDVEKLGNVQDIPMEEKLNTTAQEEETSGTAQEFDRVEEDLGAQKEEGSTRAEGEQDTAGEELEAPREKGLTTAPEENTETVKEELNSVQKVDTP